MGVGAVEKAAVTETAEGGMAEPEVAGTVAGKSATHSRCSPCRMRMSYPARWVRRPGTAHYVHTRKCRSTPVGAAVGAVAVVVEKAAMDSDSNFHSSPCRLDLAHNRQPRAGCEVSLAAAWRHGARWRLYSRSKPPGPTVLASCPLRSVVRSLPAHP